MARTSLDPGHRIPASSLLESVLALGLLACVLSFSVGLHFRVLTSDRSSDRLLAWTLSEALLAAPPSNDRREAILEMNGLTAILTLRPHGRSMREAQIIVRRGDRNVLERRSILDLQ